MVPCSADVDEALAPLGAVGGDGSEAGGELGESAHALFAGSHDRLKVAPDLMRLQAKVETIARRAGCPLDARKFVPHVTLGRFQPPPPPGCYPE